MNFFNSKRGITTVVWNKLYRKELFDNLLFKPGAKYEDKLIMKMPTKSGEHLIVHTFNKIEFEEKFREEFDCEPPAIKENHLTLLFENL